MGNRLRLLLSYHYFSKADLKSDLPELFGEDVPEIFLDSGAWSAFSVGATIDLEEYCRYIEAQQEVLEVYCNLDDMLDPEQTLRNQEQMEGWGFEPLPVFHTGEPFEVLEEYCRTHDYVGLGKLIPYTNQPKTIMPWLIRCFQVASKSGTVFHGLGATNWLFLLNFPFYSVDSSSWASGYRFGRLSVFDRVHGRFLGASIHDREGILALSTAMTEIGADWERAAFEMAEGELSPRELRGLVNRVAVRSYQAAEDWLRERHGPVCREDGREGLRIYLAAIVGNLKELPIDLGLGGDDVSDL